MPSGTVTPAVGGGPAHVSASTVIQTGSTSPVGAVTPTQTGALYQDLASGALYIAIGATSATWLCVGGASTAAGSGLGDPGMNEFLAGTAAFAIALARGSAAGVGYAALTDAVSYDTDSNGAYWQIPTGNVAGTPIFYVQLGPAGAFTHTWAADGSYAFPGTLIGPKWGTLSGGQEYQDTSAAPADGGVATSRNASYYDDTVGAPKMRWKRKDSGGAVFTGIVESASPITSGALPTTTLSSGTGAQIFVARAVETVTPFTGDGTNNAATCLVQLSPDNVTYSTLDTLTIAAALNLTGVLALAVNLRVPAGWYVKLTASHGTIGTTTYY